MSIYRDVKKVKKDMNKLKGQRPPEKELRKRIEKLEKRIKELEEDKKQDFRSYPPVIIKVSRPKIPDEWPIINRKEDI